ncbi:MAG: uroporphyrinogen decarboxylase family protein [Christensenellales bacterium]
MDAFLESFWRADAAAHLDNCFNPAATQVALGIRMSDECVFAELGEAGNPWGYTPRSRRLDLNRRYNDLAEKIVGLRLLREELPPEDAAFPAYRQIGEVFGGEYRFDGNTTWLHGTLTTLEALSAQLDRVEAMDDQALRDFVLPPNWAEEKKRIYETYGITPPVWHHVRGPVTLATSIYGVERLLFLYYDDPDLFVRLRDAIAKIILGYIDLFHREAGYCPESAPHGFSFADDDCNLMTPQMYELFGYPVLQRVFNAQSPDPGDERYQHSDSAMGHLLPILGRLNLTGCNFGPTVTVQQIRQAMPRTRIDGQLAPLTFMRNDPESITAEVKRDCLAIRQTGSRGLNLSTAGSINNGSSLASMRVVMEAVAAYGQY